MNSPTKAPGWIDKLGQVSAIGTILLALDLIYEQTFLTWTEGEQMVGFSIMHLFGPFILLLCGASFVFVVAAVVLFFRSQLRGTPVPKLTWALVGVVVAGYSVMLVPYGFWKRVTIAMKGPGPHAAQFLVYAAHDGDKSTVDLLLSKGVPVDIPNGTSTALNGACAGGQLEIARTLLKKGAEIQFAPDCKNSTLNLP